MKRVIIWSSVIAILVFVIKCYERVLLKNIISESYMDNQFVAEKIDMDRIGSNTVISEWAKQNHVEPISLEYSDERTTVVVVLMKKSPIPKSLKMEFERDLGEKIVKFGIRKDDGTVDVYEGE